MILVRNRSVGFVKILFTLFTYTPIGLIILGAQSISFKWGIDFFEKDDDFFF